MSKKKKKTKAPYGYRRIWSVEEPPEVGTASPLYRRMKRMQRLGPTLKSKSEPARLTACELHYTDLDLLPASLLITVDRDMTGTSKTTRPKFSVHAGGLRGKHTARLGYYFSMPALVTRGERGAHKRELCALAAALRDAAELLERAQ